MSSGSGNMVNTTLFGRIRTKLAVVAKLRLASASFDQSKQAELSQAPAPGRTIIIQDSWKYSFENLLADTEGLEAFTDFLQKEYSEENMKFWRQCTEYRQITDANERKAKAEYIYNMHLKEGAHDPVNVDSEAAKCVTEQLSEPSIDMFVTAETQIFNLMKTDSYTRFLRSDRCKCQEQPHIHLLDKSTAIKPSTNDMAIPGDDSEGRERIIKEEQRQADEEDINKNSLPYTSDSESTKTSEQSSPYLAHRTDRIMKQMKSLNEMKKELLTGSNPRQTPVSSTESEITDPESDTKKLLAAVEEVCNRSKTLTKDIIECAHKTLANTRIRQSTITDDIKTFLRQHSFVGSETQEEEEFLLTENQSHPATSIENSSIVKGEET